MSNRLTGETYSRQQSMRMGRFFENTLLAPLTRAQQRAMITVGHQYLMALTGKPGHAPSQAELRELGISNAQQPAFAAWLEELVGRLPTPQDMIDPNTDELHPMGAAYGAALKRFNDQVIMEPSKLDKPKLASNPVARFAFGIMSFTYTFWHQVQKPWLRQMAKDGKTILMGAIGRKDPGNAGRTAIEAASRMANWRGRDGRPVLGPGACQPRCVRRCSTATIGRSTRPTARSFPGSASSPSGAPVPPARSTRWCRPIGACAIGATSRA